MNVRIKVAVVLLALAVLLTGAVACEKKSAETTVGFVTCNMNDTFQTYVVDAATEKAGELGYKLTVQDAQEDVVRQQDQVDTLIQQGVDYLIVVPVDTSAMAPITKAAQDAKIPLVYVNRNPFGEDQPPADVYYVGSQEIVAGRFQGEELVRQMGEEGGVCILMGMLDNEGAIKRTEGNREILSKFPGITIFAEETGNWQYDEGMTITENWLTAYGDDLNAILANNDGMAIGALEALKENDRTDILVFGVDAIPDAVKLVDEGQLSGTVLQDAVGQGGGAIGVIEQLVAGKKVDGVTWVDFVLINKDNVADYLD